MWSKQFLALSKEKKYKEVLTGKISVPTAETMINASATGGAEKQKACDDNELAYHNLVLSNPNEIAFNIIGNTTTTDLSNGDAALAWRNLLAKYESKSATNIVELLRKFSQSRLTSLSNDPDDWIVELEIIKARLNSMNHTISDTSLLIHILNNLLEEYDNIVEADKKFLSDATNPLNIETLHNHLHRKWEKLVNRQNIDVHDDNDKVVGDALIAGSQFKGRCSYCGTIGHKAINCRKNPKSRNYTNGRNLNINN